MDGSIRLFDYHKGLLVLSLNGHSKAITSFCFSQDGTLLVSGSKDTDLILWDLVAENGIVRLRGHRDEITDVNFLYTTTTNTSASSSTTPVDSSTSSSSLVSSTTNHTSILSSSHSPTYLLTTSKDTTLKVWDLTLKRCIQTIVGARVELWSLCTLPSSTAWGSNSFNSDGSVDKDNAVPDGIRVIAGAGDNLLRIWSVGTRPTNIHVSNNNSNNNHDSTTISNVASSATSTTLSSTTGDLLIPMGTITRQTHERVSRIQSTPDGRYIAVQAAGKSIEVYRRRSQNDVRKRVLRRLRRQREKLSKRQREEEKESTALSKKNSKKEGKKEETMDLDDGLVDNNEGDDDDDYLFLGTSLADIDAEIKKLENLSKQNTNGTDNTENQQTTKEFVIAGDEWELVGLVSTSSRISSVAFINDDETSSSNLSSAASTGRKNALNLLLSLTNNQLELHSLPLTTATRNALGGKLIMTTAGFQVAEAVPLRNFNMSGHRTDIRYTCISSDNTLILSCSQGQAKVWNSKMGTILRTLELGDNVLGLCAAFVPGNRHVVIGTKDGHLLLFDLASADLLEKHQDHTGAIWSLAIRPDGKGLCTGSADKEIKFYDFDLVEKSTQDISSSSSDNNEGSSSDSDSDQEKTKKRKRKTENNVSSTVKVLSLVHVRTLKINDEVLCIKYSNHRDPTKLLIAVAVLDSTIKIFFEDTLKYALSLYGHKLPVMAMDISADSTLLVSASADKSVKVWGLDFGDVHKSFHAHNDGIMAIGFVANTHYFFTGSKDRTIKYWDGDRFEHILTLEGHKSEVWTLAVSPDGSFLVTGSHDRSLRTWIRTNEQVFLDEEREKEMENIVDKELRDADGETLLNAKDMVGPIGTDGLAVRSDKDTEGPVTIGPLGMSNTDTGDDTMRIVNGLPEASTVIAHATRDTMKGADKLSEALALAIEETDKWIEYSQDLTAAQEAINKGQSTASRPEEEVGEPSKNPSLLGLTPAMYILRTMRSIRPSDIDQVILTLPFSDAVRLLKFLFYLLQQGQAIELISRCILLLLRMHHQQITSNKTLVSLILALREHMQTIVQSAKDRSGYIIAGLQFMDRSLKDIELQSFNTMQPTSIISGSSTNLTTGKEKSTGKKDKQGTTKKKDDGIRIGKRQKVYLL